MMWPWNKLAYGVKHVASRVVVCAYFGYYLMQVQRMVYLAFVRLLMRCAVLFEQASFEFGNLLV